MKISRGKWRRLLPCFPSPATSWVSAVPELLYELQVPTPFTYVFF